MNPRYFKVIACEIAFREICHVAARSPNLLDLEFVTQGLHDLPRSGLTELQRRLDAVPAGRYEAILLGYCLCGNLIAGLRAGSTPFVVPRAHDCITLFLGSRSRYDALMGDGRMRYFYTSGWLECLERRTRRSDECEADSAGERANFLPTRAASPEGNPVLFAQWVERYGEEKARYLREVMEEWSRHYTHGTLIDFAFAKGLKLDERVRGLCEGRGWEFECVPGDLALLQRWVDGDWAAEDFLRVDPGQVVRPSHDVGVIRADDPGAAT